MPARPKSPANPFYVVLLVASTAFVVTALAYLMGPYEARHALANPGRGAGSRALADWLDRKGPAVLGAEFVLMFVSGLLAMATDRWFSSRPPQVRNERAESE